MNLLSLVNALLILNINISVKKAEALYNALGLGSLYSDLEYYKAEVERLSAENDVLSQTQDQALSALRAKLTFQPSHNDLVRMALGNPTVLNFVAENKKIAAVKELRAAANCGIREAKDAVEDERVVNRAATARVGA